MEKKPYVVVEWNDVESDAKGWLCAYNFVNHYCGGGTRMHPTVTREEVIRLATTMGYKYKASESKTTGGCKGGIAYDYKAPDAKEVLKRYLIAMAPYIKAGVSIGGDLGVDYGDVLNILDEIGIGLPSTKEMREDSRIQQCIKDHDVLCDMTYDGFKMYDMITGYGCAAALDEAWKIKGGKPGATVLLQGFGCVGASMAVCLDKMGYKVVGIADANCLVTCKDGLDIKKLVETRKPKGELDPAAFTEDYEVIDNSRWLDVECDVLVPAALEDVINKDNAHKVKASLIVEAANIPVTPEADRILAEKGVDICVDFVSNLGGIRIYDVAVFGLVPCEPQAIVDDTTELIRKNTRLVFEKAKKEGKGTRDVARELFAPDTFDTPDI
ncbi:Glu/Leu/Phe/Val family dehydrogenase [Sinanaerobacter chloroacetimidivorans]|jgi:glutamate dehydrogenase (NAD(P)+)|uniref:Glu/Leu/Phe/Val dehydrogenase n=1 Tax=Sinanaerobacter chloroacetimidivorans TaxID=2818044 RepID=A0A8J7W1K8_9FIRM|nr:Glu/Leu/Phe/Val dehydrogenase dimerization domain-containing protein [Sinanaerobacter chloroacetimidivorans]MBR0599144.1 Glu/Leu/Phe/Val dehydrogenase [Sinanaerobacter chloroacetimidivorans]